MKRQFPYNVRPPLRPPTRNRVSVDLLTIFEQAICKKRYSATMRRRFQGALRDDLHHQYGVDRRRRIITAANTATLSTSTWSSSTSGYETPSDSATSPCRQQQNRSSASTEALRFDSSFGSYDSSDSSLASPTLSMLSTSSTSSVFYRLTIREPPSPVPTVQPMQRILVHGRAAGKPGVTSPLGKLYRRFYGGASASGNVDAVGWHPIVDYTSDDDPGWPQPDDVYDEGDFHGSNGGGDGDDEATPDGTPSKMDSGECTDFLSFY